MTRVTEQDAILNNKPEGVTVKSRPNVRLLSILIAVFLSSQYASQQGMGQTRGDRTIAQADSVPFGRTVEKRCTACNNEVPVSSKVGDTCPHCGVRWGSEWDDKHGRSKVKKKKRPTLGEYLFSFEGLLCPGIPIAMFVVIMSVLALNDAHNKSKRRKKRKKREQKPRPQQRQ